ncbi:MAG: DUF1697 domain-containing protein [Clostridiales bacterium]|nr:DUF1697 domain-containing protein [Clostridiales bacterium]
MIFVALLRGINVGGNNKIAMKDLKVTFEQAGFARVVTYINSGNVVFSDSGRSPADLAAHLEAAILNAHGFPVTVLIRRFADFEILVRALPESWHNDDRQKCDVLFLGDAIDAPGLVEKLDSKPDIDVVLYVPGAVIWSVDRDKVTRSGLLKLVGTKLYRQMTIRNVNTVRKLYALMASQADEPIMDAVNCPGCT